MFQSPVRALLQHISVDWVRSPCLREAPSAAVPPAWLCWFRPSAFAQGSPSPLRPYGAPPGQFAACRQQAKSNRHFNSVLAAGHQINNVIKNRQRHFGRDEVGPCDFHVCSLFKHDRKQWPTRRGQRAAVSCESSRAEDKSVGNKSSCSVRTV